MFAMNSNGDGGATELFTLLESCYEKFGITRCLSLTHYEPDLGASTWSAVRPNSLVFQTANGKGLSRLRSRISSVMEAIEHYHAEHPDSTQFQKDSFAQLRRKGYAVYVPERGPLDQRFYYSEDYRIDWLEATERVSGSRVWIPASAVFYLEPTLYHLTPNGMGAGQNLDEATRHALFEVIERDAVSRVCQGGQLHIKERCKLVDSFSIESPLLASVRDKIYRAGKQLVLLWVPSAIPVFTFWAILLNDKPLVCAGYGTHTCAEQAAARAITEAAQSLLSGHHGCRETMVHRPRIALNATQTRDYFQSLQATSHWQDILPLGHQKPCLHSLEQCLAQAGYRHIFRVVLSSPQQPVTVVKVIVPKLLHKETLF